MKFWEKILIALGLAEEKDDEDAEEINRMSAFPSKEKKLVSLPGSREMKVILLKPVNFAEAEAIAGHLKQHKPVLLNVENMSTEEAKRTIDFLSGAAFALGGESQKIGAQIFIFTPANVSLTSELKSELEERRILLDRLEN